MATSGEYSAAGSAIGAAISGPAAPAGAAIGAAVGAVISLFSSFAFRTATQHLDQPAALATSQKLFDPVWAQIVQSLTSGQSSQLALDLQSSVMNFMGNSDWWSVGNDVADKKRLITDIVNEQNDRGHGSLIRMGVWIFQNSPKDNPKEALTRINDALTVALYPLLNSLGAGSLASVIQSEITQQPTSASVQGGSTGTQTQGGGFFDNLFGGNKNTSTGSGTTNHASMWSYLPWVIGAVIVIGLFTSPGRKAIQAVA